MFVPVVEVQMSVSCQSLSGGEQSRLQCTHEAFIDYYPEEKAYWDHSLLSLDTTAWPSMPSSSAEVFYWSCLLLWHYLRSKPDKYNRIAIVYWIIVVEEKGIFQVLSRSNELEINLWHHFPRGTLSCDNLQAAMLMPCHCKTSQVPGYGPEYTICSFGL